jgi:arylsulfatase A-like enzyme
MRYPPLVTGKTLCEELVLNIDLAPTLLELAGVPVPPTIQGQSWLSPLQGESGREAFLYEYFRELGPVPTVLAIRTRVWKYVTYPEDPGFPDELYDLRYDPQELVNRIDEPAYAAVIKRLRADLTDLQKQTGFPISSART